jgi:hypothetical protein
MEKWKMDPEDSIIASTTKREGQHHRLHSIPGNSEVHGAGSA